ncbi:glycosyltransferase family 2 protein [Granulosicoccus antarcticus]|uniref:O-antigen biosynthesis glycosyltransferase WbnJ n=1 Tax=Granulosicoccus antarcticus IMCC3135 TaxID=1192854 RepID=A0A2Z2P5A0_9GAMM|nr:glycosyltransferase [Granulosicoccus antarcticus]ASJ76670.1 O-antigen biosynthesis glycosyltransferase WbnJ [Granulosicoccus antarcticus IMCC3135]
MELLSPLISVLLPVRQWHESTLSAIQSILEQTHTAFELLLIGHDDVAQLADKLPADPRIRLLARQQPGIVGALNTGLKLAQGQYFARMDDDDISHPTRLATQLAYLQGESGTQLCGAGIRFIDSNARSETIASGNQRYAQWLNSLQHDQEIRASCYIECPLPHPTFMAHRDVWQQLGGYRDFDGPEDYDLILRAMLLGIRLGKPPGILLDWREHPDRLTHNDQRYRREAFTHCRAWAATQPQSGLGLAEGRSVWLCGSGRNARHWYDALTQYGTTVNGFVDISRHGPHRSKRGKPVISYEQLPEQRGEALVICALSQPGARTAFVQYCHDQQWQDLHDYILGA